MTFLDVGTEDLHLIRFFFSSMIIFKDSSACLKIQPRQIISLLKNALYFAWHFFLTLELQDGINT